MVEALIAGEIVDRKGSDESCGNDGGCKGSVNIWGNVGVVSCVN